MSFTVETLLQDIRYAARRLLRAPMFTCTAVIVLALGVGVNTAFFSLVNGVLFRQLAVPHADRLVSVTRTVHGEAVEQRGLFEYQLERLKSRQPKSVEGLIAVDHLIPVVESGGMTKLVLAEAVSGNYFVTLGLRPLAGRLLVPSDDMSGAGGSAVLSARMWRREFGANPAIVGQVVRVAGTPLVVVGIAPDGFAGMSVPNLIGADVWAPINALRAFLENQLVPPGGDRSPAARAERLGRGLLFDVYARVRPGVSQSQVAAEMRVLGGGIDDKDSTTGLAVLSASRGFVPPPLARILEGIGLALIGISSLVLFVACANLSGLVLARASRRSTEIAIRMAIGAERQRILQMQMVETGVLSALAGVAGFALAWVLTRAASLIPVPEMGGFVIQPDATPDLRVFVFALVAASATTMLVGWMPAARMADTDPTRAWSSSGGDGGVTPRMRASTSRLVAFQFGASLSLLLVASLFVRSATTATRYDAGIDMSRIAAGRINLPRQVSDQDGRAVFERLLSNNDVKGAQRVAIASGVPIGGNGRQEALRVYGRVTSYVTHTLVISQPFFEMFNLQLVSGRRFTGQDVEGQPNVAIINELVASELWPGRNPIGQSVRVSSMRGNSTVTVVGVVKETDRAARVAGDRRYMFLPLAQHYQPDMAVLLSGPGDASVLVSSLKKIVASATPEVAVFDVKPLASFIGIGATGATFAAAAVGAVGILGFFIAMVGLYGTVAYVVGERTREFGIMRALGADAGHIRRLVLGDAIRMLLWGMAPGFVVTFLSAGLLQSWLLGLPAHDPVTFLIVPLVMFIVGCGAALIPAHRASKTDPTTAIRHL